MIKATPRRYNFNNDPKLTIFTVEGEQFHFEWPYILKMHGIWCGVGREELAWLMMSEQTKEENENGIRRKQA